MAEKEYIEREEAYKMINEAMTAGMVDVFLAGQRRADFEEALEALEEVPTADVQPVVYCKDCKYREEHHYEEEGEEPYIKYGCKFSNYMMPDYGFCSCGARSMHGGDSHD